MSFMTYSAVLGVVGLGIVGPALAEHGEVPSWLTASGMTILGGLLLYILRFTIPSMTKDHKEVVDTIHKQNKEVIEQICKENTECIKDLAAEVRGVRMDLGQVLRAALFGKDMGS